MPFQFSGGVTDGDKGDIAVTGDTWTIDPGTVTYAKIQDVSASDTLLGRFTAGAGDTEEITCTAAGRALLDDADAAAQRSTLGAAAASHTHTQADVTNLVSDLADKQPLAVSLTTLTGLTQTTNNFIVAVASVWASVTPTVVTALLDTFTAALKGVVPASGGGTTNFLRADGIWTSPGAGSTNIKQTEIDFGTTPVSEATFTITDADVSISSQLIAQVAWEAPTGKDLDEIEMDDLQIRCKPASGTFDMFIQAADGSYLADKFKINYLVG